MARAMLMTYRNDAGRPHIKQQRPRFASVGIPVLVRNAAGPYSARPAGVSGCEAERQIGPTADVYRASAWP